MAKLKVYVQSLEISAAGFVDKEGAMHSFCAPGLKEATFQGIGHQSGLFGNRYLSEEDRKFLENVDGFCKNNGLKYDVVDLEGTSFLSKLILRMKGIKAPAVVFGQRTLQGIPLDEDLKRLVKS